MWKDYHEIRNNLFKCYYFFLHWKTNENKLIFVGLYKIVMNFL
jgi:hypothetical protein